MVRCKAVLESIGLTRLDMCLILKRARKGPFEMLRQGSGKDLVMRTATSGKKGKIQEANHVTFWALATYVYMCAAHQI